MKKQIYGFVFLALVIIFCQAAAWSQQAPPQQLPANVTGKWTLYCNDPNGTTSAKYLDLKQDDNGNIKGHFKGTYQSGSVQGTIDGHHLVVRTNTRDVIVFRGRVDGPRIDGVVQGNTYDGSFHNRGGRGTFQGVRAQ
jgi:hypothetical protein